MTRVGTEVGTRKGWNMVGLELRLEQFFLLCLFLLFLLFQPKEKDN